VLAGVDGEVDVVEDDVVAASYVDVGQMQERRHSFLGYRTRLNSLRSGEFGVDRESAKVNEQQQGQRQSTGVLPLRQAQGQNDKRFSYFQGTFLLVLTFYA
jgi:hypothetical protein